MLIVAAFRSLPSPRHLLEQRAAQIRINAELQAGKMLKAMGERGERSKGRRKSKESNSTILSDVGITPDQSSRWQQMADGEPAASRLERSDAPASCSSRSSQAKVDDRLKLIPLPV